MRTLTLRKAIWDVNLAVFFDRPDDPRTKKYGGNSANSPITIAPANRLYRLIGDKHPCEVGFGPVGLIVRYSFPDKL